MRVRPIRDIRRSPAAVPRWSSFSSSPLPSLPAGARRRTSSATPPLERRPRGGASRHPELQAARERASAARAEPARVSSYDDPVVSWEAWNTPESFRIDQADNNIFKLSQKIPFPGKRSLAGRMAERDADVASDDASAAERDLIAMVKRATTRSGRATRTSRSTRGTRLWSNASPRSPNRSTPSAKSRSRTCSARRSNSPGS